VRGGKAEGEAKGWLISVVSLGSVLCVSRVVPGCLAPGPEVLMLNSVTSPLGGPKGGRLDLDLLVCIAQTCSCN
jgi:hypothetical protein